MALPFTANVSGRPRRLRADAFLAVTGTVAFSLGQWAVLVILARIGTPTLVGGYALGLSIATPVILLASLALRTVLVTDADAWAKFPTYLALRLLLVCGATLLLITLAILNPAIGVVGMIVALTKALDAVSDLYFGMHQRAHDMLPVACAQVVNGIGSPLAVLVVYQLGAGPLVALSASIGASIASATYSIYSLRTHVYADRQRSRFLFVPSFDRQQACRLVRIAAPIGCASAVTALLWNLPRYALAASDGTASLGVFMAVSSFTLAGLTVVSAGAQALLPRLVNTSRRHGSAAMHGQVMAYALASLLFTAPLVLLALLVGPALLGAIFGAEYALRGPFAVLMLGLGLASASWMVDVGLAAKRRFDQQFQASMIALAVGMCCAPLMSHLWHISGAAWATLIVAATHLIVRLVLLHAGRNCPTAKCLTQ